MSPKLRDFDICLFQGLKIWKQVLFPWLLVGLDLTPNDKTKLQNYKIFCDEKVVDYKNPQPFYQKKLFSLEIY